MIRDRSRNSPNKPLGSRLRPVEVALVVFDSPLATHSPEANQSLSGVVINNA